MGCVSSKHGRNWKKSPRPPTDNNSDIVLRGNNAIIDSSSYRFHSGAFSGHLEKIREESEKESEEESVKRRNHHHHSKAGGPGSASLKRAAFSFRFGRLTEAEHAAAGWPAWLTAVAGEAIEGWLPLRSDMFERYEKIGQGTYSSVYRAQNLETGKMVALKKVRFDNFQPESVRFMAREITILRRLHHRNIMKLEGIITSRLSTNIYLVFEYMEHDLSGLLSSPGIKFTESQIKCYMQQLLSGLEHCHSRGIMHRDIKASNILVNNEGILKIADFGLANFVNDGRTRAPLTSRVVTLWYRPPELLLGSTSYGLTVDLWSMGCVFAELFIGRPLLKGRTEVEQLHKIFKLCGTPPEEYWKVSRLPLATMFKPQNPYESTLRERCKEFPKSAVNLIETFLSIDPQVRGTASSALESEYFRMKPYPCDPSSLPKYPPNKEMDAKIREESKRKRAGSMARTAGTKNPRRSRRSGPLPTQEIGANAQFARRNNSFGITLKDKAATISRMSMKVSDTVSEASQMTEQSEQSHADSTRSVPIEMSASGNFTWAHKRKQSASRKMYNNVGSRSRKLIPLPYDPPSVLETAKQELMWDTPQEMQASDDHETVKRGMSRQRLFRQTQRMDSFDSSDIYESQDFSVDYSGKPARVKSGPLVYRNASSIHQDGQFPPPIRRSRFYRDLQ